MSEAREAITKKTENSPTKEAQPLSVRRGTGGEAERVAFARFGEAADELLRVGLAGLSESLRQRVADAVANGATLRAAVDFGASSFGVYLVAAGAAPVFLFGARHELPRLAIN